MKFRRTKQYKGFIIAADENGDYSVFTMEEWSLGHGCRYPEWESCGTVYEAMEWIDSE
jgi:hypothetical protein